MWSCQQALLVSVCFASSGHGRRLHISGPRAQSSSQFERRPIGQGLAPSTSSAVASIRPSSYERAHAEHTLSTTMVETDSRVGRRRKTLGSKMRRERQHKFVKCSTAAGVSALACAMLMGPLGLASTKPVTSLLNEVRSPFDRQVDTVLRPLWRVLMPLQSVANWILLSPVRTHLRIESLRSGDAWFHDPHGARKVQAASDDACSSLQRFAQFNCPKVLIVRGAVPKIAAFPLGRGRDMLLVATQGFAENLEGNALRFAVGREIGRAALGHGARIPRWAIARFAGDNLALPRYLLRRTRPRREDVMENATMAKQPVGAQQYNRWYVARVVERVGDFCELYRGLRTGGYWPGLGDLDMDQVLSGLTGGVNKYAYRGQKLDAPFAGSLPTGGVDLQALDMVAAVCTKARTPDGIRGLTGALLGIAAPKLAATAFGFDETMLRRGLRVSAWTFAVWAFKLRAEMISADRLGLIAASGDVDAAVRSMLKLAGRKSAAVAALVGVETLAEQAQTLDRVMPRKAFDVEPSLHTRIAELTAWAASPDGLRILQLARR